VHVRTEAEVTEGVLRDRIASGGSELDEAAAVATALEAFADGLYLVFIDDEQITELSAPVEIRPTSTPLFVRLVPLAGGRTVALSSEEAVARLDALCVADWMLGRDARLKPLPRKLRTAALPDLES
jgi:hypothetical protein